MTTVEWRQKLIAEGRCVVCQQPSTLRQNGVLAKTCIRCVRKRSRILQARQQAEARGSAVQVRRKKIAVACLLCNKLHDSTEPTDRYHPRCRKRLERLRDYFG